MTYLKESSKYYLLSIFLVINFYSCKEELPVITPNIITEKTPHDTDDPAIWINESNPSNSIIFGTDKDEINGGVYAFDLEGNIIEEKSITGISYPNNVDVSYNFMINDSTFTDVLAFTEREKNQIRLFAVPSMISLDNGGFEVFQDESETRLKRPMGIAFYYNNESEKMYLIISRKEGPKENYLYQYELYTNNSIINLKLVRKFGEFSGKKEIEAIAVDQELGYIYYSDEDYCIRKYYADPNKGNDELACFGAERFKRDIEGIALVKNEANSGYIVVSNQQAHSFVVFDRQTNAFIKEINLGSIETDGCEVTTRDLGNKFPEGVFISMTDSKEFLFHDLRALELN
jgi:3-phytase